MFVALLLTHLLDALGVIYIVSVAVKVSRGFPISRWFF